MSLTRYAKPSMFEALPNHWKVREVWQHIAALLDFRDSLSLSLTCRWLQQILKLENMRQAIRYYKIKKLSVRGPIYRSNFLALDNRGKTFAFGGDHTSTIWRQTFLGFDVTLKNIANFVTTTISTFYITTEGQVYSCGTNKYSQLGIERLLGVYPFITFPTMISNLTNIKQISAVDQATYFLNDAGKVFF